MMDYLSSILKRKNPDQQPDSRSTQGILSRGKNIYNGGSNAAHRGGGPQYGRPREGPQLVGPNSILQRITGVATQTPIANSDAVKRRLQRDK